MTHRRLLSVTFLALLAAMPASAAEADEVPMGLEDCLKLTLDNNPDIAVSERDARSAELLHQAAHGIFDTLLNAGLDTSRSESPSTSQLSGADVLTSDRTQLSIGASQFTAWGGSASLTLFTQRSESNSTFSSLNPAYTSDLTLSLTQPLLRGFGKVPTKYQIKLSKIAEKQARHRHALSVIATVQSVEGAYWDIVLARDDLDVKRQSLKVAEDLLSQNKIRVEVGTLAPIELVQAEAGVALRAQAIIVAEALHKDTEESLKRLMGVPPGDPLWGKTIRPSDKFSVPALPGSLDEALGLAREKRQELRIAAEDVASSEITTAYRKQQRLPGLDAKASYTSGGVGGDEIVYDPATGQPIGKLSGGLGDAFDQTTGLDFPSWVLGLSFSYPVRNRAALNNYAAARLDEEKAAIRKRKTELEVETDVRAAFRAVETARKNVEASRVSERAQAKKLEAEQKKFENGLSTSFQVLEFDEDLAQARSDLRRAETSVHKAAINLLRAAGTLLSVKGYALEE